MSSVFTPPRFPTSFFILILIWLASLYQASGQEQTTEGELKKLRDKFGLPSPEKIEAGTVWYHLIVVPEFVTEVDSPLIVSVSCAINTLHRAESGHIFAYRSIKGKSTLIGDRGLSSEEAEEIMKLSGQYEVFSLRSEQKFQSYEFFPHFGGNERILIRADWEGVVIVRRLSWASEPIKIFSDRLIDHVDQFLPPDKKMKGKDGVPEKKLPANR